MRDDGLVMAKGACDSGCRHLLSAEFRGQRSVVDCGIGVLDQAWQQADEHGAPLRLLKFLYENGNGRRRGNLAQVQTTHAIGNDEEIAVRTSLVAGIGNE